MVMVFPKTLIHGPVYSIMMPLDKDGNGPCEESEASVIYYEVWDQVCNTICQCRSKQDAERIAELINADTEWERGW